MTGAWSRRHADYHENTSMLPGLLRQELQVKERLPQPADSTNVSEDDPYQLKNITSGIISICDFGTET